MKTNTDILFSRRSIRKYKNRERVPEDVVQYILSAAMSAPSARNTQAWQFIVTQNHDILNTLSERHPYAGMLKEASLAILVCGDKRAEENEIYLVQNCSAATQNILLAAHGQGLGAVWLGVNPREERMNMCREVFNLPDYVIPVALISIGYPGEKKDINKNYSSSKVHWDKWQE